MPNAREIILSESDKIKLFTKFVIGDPDECWPWLDKPNENGYGLFWSRLDDGTTCLYKAHRVVYTVMVGPIPIDRDLCHTCDNPPCVNPYHKFIGTEMDNWVDSNAKGRTSLPPVHYGWNNWSTVLTKEQVLEIRAIYPSKTQRALARKYGVTQTAIWCIVNRKTWDWI